MSQFKTQAEIWQALLDGKTIVSINGKSHFKIKDGYVCENDMQTSSVCFWNPKSWSIYEPPKPKKILKPFLCRSQEVDSAAT